MILTPTPQRVGDLTPMKRMGLTPICIDPSSFPPKSITYILQVIFTHASSAFRRTNNPLEPGGLATRQPSIKNPTKSKIYQKVKNLVL